MNPIAVIKCEQHEIPITHLCSYPTCKHSQLCIICLKNSQDLHQGHLDFISSFTDFKGQLAELVHAQLKEDMFFRKTKKDFEKYLESFWYGYHRVRIQVLQNIETTFENQIKDLREYVCLKNYFNEMNQHGYTDYRLRFASPKGVRVFKEAEQRYKAITKKRNENWKMLNEVLGLFNKGYGQNK